MPSLIPGYEYDIFISYRHNDNLDGWVTEFVLNLENELKATVKESLKIYFDKNPHDGLLQTHNVDMDQKEEALMCLSKAYDEKYRIVHIKESPYLKKLRDDPRYQALLIKMNLPMD